MIQSYDMHKHRKSQKVTLVNIIEDKKNAPDEE